MLCRRLEMLPVEASRAATWSARAGRTTRRAGASCGIALPAGLRAGRATAGADLHAVDEGRDRHHDENISFRAMVATIGADSPRQVRDATLAIYKWAADYAPTRGIIIADTKFEFGTRRRRQAVRDATRC